MTNLNDMSLEELWQLFPIILKEHNSEYTKWYEEQKEYTLSRICSDKVARISHIGSTAVPGLIAKPTVDILLEIDKSQDTDMMIGLLEKCGWGLMQAIDKDGPGMKCSFCKGYTPEGYAEKVFHLHMCYHGDHPEPYFRDYLIKHKEAAAEYVALKKELAVKFRNDRNKYTHEKGLFIKKYTELAREEFGNRYEPIKNTNG